MHHAHIDKFAQGDSLVHRLDARAKLLAVVAFTAVVISYDRYAVGDLLPLAIFPLAMLWLAGVPTWFALRRAIVLVPFIAMLALLSPLYDRAASRENIGPWTLFVSGGWITATDVTLKFFLSVLAMTALMCTTPFSLMLEAMRKMLVPKILVMQLGFLYRYIFVLVDEAMRIRRARDFRGASRAPISRRLAVVGGVIGMLFGRTLDRSDRIHLAMTARGYRGEPRSLSRLNFGWSDAAFLIFVAAYLFACRFVYSRWF